MPLHALELVIKLKCICRNDPRCEIKELTQVKFAFLIDGSQFLELKDGVNCL